LKIKNIPVGLWAQACNNKTEPSGILLTSSNNPEILTPFVLLSKYLNSLNYKWESRAMFIWFGHVGLGIYTVVPSGKYLLINSNPSLTAPVPLNT